MPLSQLIGRQTSMDGPALPPPEGVVSNFVDPPNQNEMAVGVTVMCLVISSIFLLARAYSKLAIVKTVRPEDVVGLAAFLCYLGYIICVFRFLDNTGYFVHQWNVQLRKMPEFLHIILIGGNFYAVNIMCIKVAIMLEWLRIFVPHGTRNAFFWVCWAVLILNTCFYVANIFALNLACIPHRAIWDITIKGRCIDQRTVNSASAIVNLISDVTLMILAQQVIWRLQMSLKKKIGVSLIFAVGIVGCLAGGFRLAVTLRYQEEHDLTHSVSAVILWAIGEMTAGFLVFCVPAMPKAFGRAGLPSRLASALRSWTGISSRHSSTSKESPSWRQDTPSPSESYRNLEKGQSPQLDLPFQGQSSFDSSENLRSSSPISPGNGGILRTTDLVTTLQHDTDNDLAREGHSRQHPWVGA